MAQHGNGDSTHDDQMLTCMCGCGKPTRHRFKQGHDARLYGWLKAAQREGDREAADLHDFVVGNNNPSTFPEQRRRVRHWLGHR